MRFASQRPLPFPARRIVIRSDARSRSGASAGGSSGAAAVARTPHANTFTDKRIRHAVELVGSCMLMALFVVLALFA